MITSQLEIQPETLNHIGFSSQAWDVVQRKPSARILDCTAGNRHIWNVGKFRDDVIFTDKETGLKISPDLITSWQELPRHFPPDYFHCVIFDPPHQTAGKNKTCRWAKSPDESICTWYGAYRSNRELRTDIMQGVRAISKVSPRLCFKWCSEERSFGTTNINRILTVFLDWKVVWMNAVRKTDSNITWWVKLVRKDERSMYCTKGD